MPNSNTPPRTGKFDEEIERKRLRDQFAGRAMVALLAELAVVSAAAQASGKSIENYIGITAYEIADGMMKARDGK